MTFSSVTRETLATVFEKGKHRRVYVSINPVTGVLTFRAKGLKSRYELPANFLYGRAVAQHVNIVKKQKKKEREEKRKAKKR